VRRATTLAWIGVGCRPRALHRRGRASAAVEALIERAQGMRAWLLTATDCSCTSLDVCALFDRDEEAGSGSDGAGRFHVTHVAGVAA
jgi:hypothetical protein